MDGLTDRVPVWLAGVVASVLFVAGAAIGLYAKWRRTRNELRAEENKTTVTDRRESTELQIKIRDDQILAWKQYAEEQKQRADKADERSNLKDEEWTKRMETMVTRYHDRENAQAKQHEEREIQFGTIIDRIRGEYDTKIDTVSKMREECLRESSQLRGALEEVRRINEGHERRIIELEHRLLAKDTRR